jgi:aminopeptidase
MSRADYAEETRRLADLVVSFGANVQPGQILSITSFIGKEALTREIARAAYERGARWVDVLYFDQWLKRERIAHAPDDSLDFVPEWMLERLRWLSDEHASRLYLSGPQAPTALDGLDPGRAGRDLLPYLPQTGEVVNARTTNWSICPAPTPAWAEAVYPELPPEQAYERLWEAIAHVCRLDEEDPVAAWNQRFGLLRTVARRLTERRFDRLHYRGPGTDLTVGLLRSSRWQAAPSETVDGVEHFPNLPSEETFTTPDPDRADGHVTATMPLELYGSMISGIRVEFAGGRAVKIDADQGADALRAAAAKDEGASRLGEVALVDGHGRIGPLGTIFYDTLLDENAASHIALGNGYLLGVEDDEEHARVNASAIHVDFMIGRPELEVDGVTAAGERVPLLRGGDWQL